MKFCGRDFRVGFWDGANFTPISGEKSSSVSLVNEAVDTTGKSVMSWRELRNCGLRSLDVSLDGNVTDGAVYTALVTRALTASVDRYKIISGSGDSFDFFAMVVAKERSGDHNSAETYSLSLASTKIVAFGPLIAEVYRTGGLSGTSIATCQPFKVADLDAPGETATVTWSGTDPNYASVEVTVRVQGRNVIKRSQAFQANTASITVSYNDAIAAFFAGTNFDDLATPTGAVWCPVFEPLLPPPEFGECLWPGSINRSILVRLIGGPYPNGLPAGDYVIPYLSGKRWRSDSINGGRNTIIVDDEAESHSPGAYTQQRHVIGIGGSHPGHAVSFRVDAPSSYPTDCPRPGSVLPANDFSGSFSQNGQQFMLVSAIPQLSIPCSVVQSGSLRAFVTFTDPRFAGLGGIYDCAHGNGAFWLFGATDVYMPPGFRWLRVNCSGSPNSSSLTVYAGGRSPTSGDNMAWSGSLSSVLTGVPSTIPPVVAGHGDMIITILEVTP